MWALRVATHSYGTTSLLTFFTVSVQLPIPNSLSSSSYHLVPGLWSSSKPLCLRHCFYAWHCLGLWLLCMAKDVLWTYTLFTPPPLTGTKVLLLLLLLLLLSKSGDETPKLIRVIMFLMICQLMMTPFTWLYITLVRKWWYHLIVEEPHRSLRDSPYDRLIKFNARNLRLDHLLSRVNKCIGTSHSLTPFMLWHVTNFWTTNHYVRELETLESLKINFTHSLECDIVNVGSIGN